MKGDFDLTLRTINLDFPDPSIVFNFVFDSEMIGGANFARYRNREVDQLIGRADRSLDSAERTALYQQAQRRVMADLPTVPLFQYDWQRVERRELQGIRYNFAQPTFFNSASMTREGS